MNILAIILLYIGINIDTFIALLFTMKSYSFRTIITAFVASDVILWLIGVIIGKTIVYLFPDWLTGLFGFVLLYLAFRRDGQQVTTQHSGLMTILLLCLSLGGDNLVVYIPWAGKMGINTIVFITVIFILCSVIATYLLRVVANIKPIAFFLEKYGTYCTRLVYFCAGLNIIYSNHVISHLVNLIR